MEKRLTIKEATIYLGYKNAWNVYELIRRKKIKAFRRGPEEIEVKGKRGRKGGALTIPLSELKRFANSGEK